VFFHPNNTVFLVLMAFAIFITVLPFVRSSVLRGPQLYVALFAGLGGMVVQSFTYEAWATVPLALVATAVIGWFLSKRRFNAPLGVSRRSSYLLVAAFVAFGVALRLVVPFAFSVVIAIAIVVLLTVNKLPVLSWERTMRLFKR